jgi:hypothetical protein
MPGAEVLPFLSLGFRAVKLSCEIYTLMNIIEDHAKDLNVFRNLLQLL